MIERNFIINPPAYYEKIHGEIPEINRMLLNLSNKIDLFTYTFSMNCISISPIIVPLEIRNNGVYSEKALICLEKGLASISLFCDYDEFCNGDLEKKKQIIVENVLSSLEIVKNKTTEHFDFEKIKKDVIRFANLSYVG